MASTDALRKLPSATLVYGLGDLAPKALHFILLPLYLQHLDPAEFGTLALATSYSLLLGFLLQLNLNGSVFRFLTDQTDETGRRRFVGTLLIFQVGWSLAVVLAGHVVGPWLWHIAFGSSDFDAHLRLATWLALVTSLPMLPLSALQMRQEAGTYRALTALGSVLSTLAILFFVVKAQLGALGFLMGQLTGGLLMLAPYAWVTLPRVRLVVAPGVIRTCLIFSLPLVPYTIGGWVLDLSNRYLIERYLDVGELGRYNAGYQFALVMQAALNAFALAWVPIFYQLVKEPNAPKRLARFGKAYWCVTLMFALGLAVLAKDVLAMFANEAYSGAYAVIPILVATQATTCLWHLVVNPLFLVRKTAILPLVMAMAAIVSVTLNIALIPAAGLVGAALSVFVGNLTLTGVAGVISLRYYPIRYDYGRLALAAAAAVLIFYLANGISMPSPTLTTTCRILMLGTYPLTLLILRVFRVEELRELLGAVRHRRSPSRGE